ncbi:MAG TPA: hypothetical protein VFN74_21060, partial [Chloroflexota bacterium]|nr:hypothetical protein [Chloroflexota bacterium]
MAHAGGHGRAPVTRRTMFEHAGKAAALAGGVLAGAVRTGVAQAGVSAQSRITGKLQVVTPLDFHPDHNKYIQEVVRAFTGAKGWDTDISDINAYQGGTDIYQRLQAQKAAGTPVDIMLTHSLDARLEFMYELTRDATP